MTDSIPPKTPFSAKYGFRILSFSLLFASIAIEVLVLLLMESTFYEQKKQQIARQEPLAKISEALENKFLKSAVVLDPRRDGALTGDEKMTELRKTFIGVMELCNDPDFPVIKLEIVNKKGKILAVWKPNKVEEKERRLNTWKDSFLDRDFVYMATRARSIYDLRVYLITFPGIPEVRELVVRYRLYASLFTLANLLAVWFFYRGAIRPLGRITTALGGSTDGFPPVVANPRHNSERSYNTLARATRLSRVETQVFDLWDRVTETGVAAPRSGEDFWTPALEVIRRGMNYEWAAWFPLEGGETVGEPIAVGETPSLDNLPRLLGENSENSGPAFLYRSGDGFVWASSTMESDSPPLLVGTVRKRDEAAGYLVARATDDREGVEVKREPLASLTRQLGFLLTRSLERQEEMDRGRFEVSIDLSASMGHDLTNILATGRLELETLRSAYKRGFIEVPENRREAVEQSLEGLRKTTGLLQEVVNVYRAFSFTRAPHPETVELNELIDAVIVLYQHSTSRKIEFVHNRDGTLVNAHADPRLLKLVLFNLLANATQAIADRQSLHPEPDGKVEVDCRVEGGLAILRVTDNGTGFQDPTGHRLEGVELQQIFQFDFTTKTRQGGLGLAWVRSIVEEVHEGKLVPSNRMDGTGAVMEVHLDAATEEA